METTLSYLLKSGVALLALYLFYGALLRRQTNFRFNRAYLLLAPLLALALPLVRWPALLPAGNGVAQTLRAFQLAEVTVVAGAAQGDTFFSPANVVSWIYLLVALSLAAKLLRQLWHIRSLKAKATAVPAAPAGARVVLLPQASASFAFLNTVYLGEQGQLSAQEQQQVLAHELAHVRLGHTYDVLLYELLSVLWWFNPILWLLKRELRSLHEFQADARVVEQFQPQAYSALLAKEALLHMGLPVGSYFQRPQVLQRLHMLQQHGKRSGWGKPLLSLPLLGMLLLLLSSSQADGIKTQTGAYSTENTQATPTPPPRELSPEPRNLPELKPYTYVEQMPQFEGGEQAMLNFLGQNIRYPEAAKKASLEGLVVLAFTVETDGSLRDVQVLKKLGLGTDEEALRVVEQMSGRWEPGSQNGQIVPVKYTLPIRFAIK